MDITDIFDDEPTKKPEAPKPEAPSLDVGNIAKLRDTAKAVARLYDVAAQKENSYGLERTKRLDAMDKELAHLKAEADAAADELSKAATLLQESMEADGVNTITMPDRTPIKLKTSPGRRKPLSKKLLTEVYGKAKAEDVWAETEKKGPDKKTLVIPAPFEDEPGI